jgi:hypothetical protein
MKWQQADKQHCPVHDQWLHLKLNGLPHIGYRIAGQYLFSIHGKEYSFDQVEYLDEHTPDPSVIIAALEAWQNFDPRTGDAVDMARLWAAGDKALKEYGKVADPGVLVEALERIAANQGLPTGVRLSAQTALNKFKNQ